MRQLRALKNDPRAGAVGRAAHEEVKAKLMAAIGHEEHPQVETSPVYYRWYVRNLISRPIAVSVAGVVLMTSGWMTTVSAAADSLPGDTLYTIKLVTERAQLQIASLDRKAVLHTEFAGRRLKEVSELQKTEQESQLVREAVDAYKKELASAQENLVELKQNNQVAAIQTANQVQQRISSLEVTIDNKDAASPVTTEVQAEVKQSTREAEVSAVDLAVDVVQEGESEDETTSKQELEEMFRREVGDLQARQTFDIHRLEAVEKAIVERELNLPKKIVDGSVLDLIRSDIDQAVEVVPSAMNAYTAGDYQSAFDSLRAAEQALLNIEARLADLEIAVMASYETQSEGSTLEQPVTKEEDASGV